MKNNLQKEIRQICAYGKKTTNKEFLKELKKRITFNVGRKCKDFCYGCFICQVWVAYSVIEDMLMGEEEYEK